jgi:hypothetical protein
MERGLQFVGLTHPFALLAQSKIIQQPLVLYFCYTPAIVTIKVFSKFRAHEKRYYHKMIWLPILKILREERMQSETSTCWVSVLSNE